MNEQHPELIAGRYQLVERIGQGGMGRVWRGLDQQLFGREVAVKEIVFPPGLEEADRATLLRRFTGEARAAVTLSHPGIITVHDVVEHRGAPVIVMELVRGQSLAAVLRERGRLPVRRVAEIGAAMLDALAEAHRARIVHRDIKPDNVLLTRDRVVLTDFGIAHLADATTKLSHSGSIIGTPQYMAPEQLDGKRPTPANDLWALGATLYHAVEGRPPFEAEGLHALAVAVFTRPHRPPEHAGPLAPVLEALLVKDPAERADAATAADLLAAVLRAPSDPRTPPPPRTTPTPPTTPAPAPTPIPTPTLADPSPEPEIGEVPEPGNVPERAPEAGDVPTPTEVVLSLGETTPVTPGGPTGADTAGSGPGSGSGSGSGSGRRALTRRSLVLGAALATLGAGSALTWILDQDEDPGGSTGGKGSGGGSAAETAVTVVLGVAAPLTGGLSAMGLGVRNSADLAVRTANEKRYVPGVRFEIRALDDAADPAKGAANAAAFAADPKLLGVVGPVTSGVAKTLLPGLSGAGIADVSPSNTDPVLTLGPDWATGTLSRPYGTYFRTMAPDVVQGPFAARHLYTEAGKTKVYVIDDGGAYGTALAAGFTTEFERLGGTVVGAERVAAGAREFPGVAGKVRASGAEAVWFGGYYDTAAALSGQLKAGGARVPLMGGDGIFDEQFLSAGPEADGDLALNIGLPAADQPGGPDFLARYEKAGYAEPAGWYGPYAYDAAWALIEGVKTLVAAHGGTLPTDARAGLPAAVGRLAFDGVTGHVSFDQRGDVRSRHVTVHRVESGRWTTVTSGPAPS
ncbi:bifunctional serine/threonine-protein kinase/ABC transporter substrate-binding protein [Streptomyces sp. NPDC097619]|uniref:bifunctional serine/threonine-protein kinase/ABC transporter substrate-binding protein n=1 Tax=Streptomyces sp. NPDC097619 TaxID=3157228 RepID=UPI0033276753